MVPWGNPREQPPVNKGDRARLDPEDLSPSPRMDAVTCSWSTPRLDSHLVERTMTRIRNKKEGEEGGEEEEVL